MDKLKKSILICLYLMAIIFILAVVVVNISKSQLSVEWLRFIIELSNLELWVLMFFGGILLMTVCSKFISLCNEYEDELEDEDIFEYYGGIILIIIVVSFIISCLCSLIWIKSWLGAFSPIIISASTILCFALKLYVIEIFYWLSGKIKKQS